MFRSSLTLIVALVCCSALAACGNSDTSSSTETTSSSTTSTAASTSATEFVAQADAICKQSQAEVLAITRQGGAAQAAGESQSEPFGKLADLLTSVESDLAELTPPADLASTYADYLNGLQQTAATTADLADAFGNVQPGEVSPEVRAIGKQMSAETQASAKLAAELGFRVCS